MIPVYPRPRLRLWSCLLLGLLPLPLAATPPLDYAAALRLAVEQQPQLRALSAEAEAARQRAVAAGELPDPMLSFGISEIPVNTDDRFSLYRDGDTDVMLGLRQEFPRAEKRRLAREREQQLAEGLDAEHAARRRWLRREAGLAWLGLWWTDAAEPLIGEDLDQARLQHEALEIAYTQNAASQSALLAAEVAAAEIEDRLDELAQQREIARQQLARWIGMAAQRPVQGAPPGLEADGDGADIAARLAALDAHPHVLAEATKLALADTEIALARQDYRPDWALNLGFGYRPAFSEMGTVMVEIPLPVFTARRQDARLAAAEARRVAEAATLDDLLREHRAHIRSHGEALRHLRIRSRRFDERLLPAADAQVAAALADYAAGRGGLMALIDARRQRLGLRLQALALQRDAAERVIQLDYFAPLPDAALSPEPRS